MEGCCKGFLWLGICLSLAFLDVASVESQVPEVSCPESCICQENNVIVCRNITSDTWSVTCKSITQFVSDKETIPDLILSGLLSNVSLSLRCIPSVRLLNVSSTHMDLSPRTFKNIQVLESLILSQNGIEVLPSLSFEALNAIVLLNLSFNQIKSLESESFCGLFSLQTLDLSFNNISVIHPLSFQVLTNLTHLNLNGNKINHFTSWHLPLSNNLLVVVLRANLLKSFYVGNNESDSKSLHSLKSLDISHNPLECTCVLQKLLKTMASYRGVLMNRDETQCSSPSAFKNMSVAGLNETNLSCDAPHSIVSFPSNGKSVLYTATITLECRAEALPSPHILWVTPWGEKFSIAPHSLIVHTGLAEKDEVHSFKEYEEMNVMMTSSIQVSPANDLIVTHFRGSLAGNFSCVAFNEVGSQLKTIHLSIRSMIISTYHTSLKFASYCASAGLIIGFIIGSIHKCVRCLREGKLFKVPLFTPATSVRPAGDTFSCTHEEYSPPTSPLMSTKSERSLMSSQSQLLSEGRESPDKRTHLLDSIEGAKERLRGGVGRKMESVRRNVQSIKESTGAYVHTIMESGSTAANRMKAGVVTGVETVKYHVRSVKELCGTGNMGMHTMSIVSMETDIDTNEQKSVIRQVTFV